MINHCSLLQFEQGNEKINQKKQKPKKTNNKYVHINPRPRDFQPKQYKEISNMDFTAKLTAFQNAMVNQSASIHRVIPLGGSVWYLELGQDTGIIRLDKSGMVEQNLAKCVPTLANNVPICLSDFPCFHHELTRMLLDSSLISKPLPSIEDVMSDTRIEDELASSRISPEDRVKHIADNSIFKKMREQNLILMAYMKENMLACESVEEACMQMQSTTDHKKKRKHQNENDINTAKSKQPK